MASKQVSFTTASRSAESYTSLREKLRSMRSQSARSSAAPWTRKHAPKKAEEPTTAFVLDDHPQELQAGAQSFWREDFFQDACVIVEDKSFLVHRLVLASYSAYFRNIFMVDQEANEDGMFEITLSGVQAKVADNVIQSMYTSRLNLSSTNVFDVLELADGLKYTVAVQACTKYLRDNLNLENCLRTMSLAISYHLDDLKEDSGKFAADRFEEVKNTAGFIALEWYTLRDFIARDDLRVTRELQVFQAVVSWLQKDRAKREKWAVRLMENVRFPLMTPNEVVDNVESVGFLMSVPEFQELVKEATHYHLTPLRQSILQSPRTNPRSSVRLPAVLGIGGTGKNGGVITCFSPASGEWRTFTKMETVARHHHAVAVLGGFVYIVGGEELGKSKSVLSTACRYDPRTGEWLTVASMNKCRQSFQLGVLDDFLYAVDGAGSLHKDSPELTDAIFNVSNKVLPDDLRETDARGTCYPHSCTDEVYSARQTRLVGNLVPLAHERRKQGLGGSLGRSWWVQVMGGVTWRADGGRVTNQESLSDVERYNPQVDQWEDVAPISTPRRQVAVATHNRRLYAMGGSGNGSLYAMGGSGNGSLYAMGGSGNGSLYAMGGSGNASLYAMGGSGNASLYAMGGSGNASLYAMGGSGNASLYAMGGSGNASLYAMGGSGNGNLYAMGGSGNASLYAMGGSGNASLYAMGGSGNASLYAMGGSGNASLYAMGGSGHNRISNKLERYNPLTNHWEQKRPLLTNRFSASLQPVGGRLYLVGGVTVVKGHTVVGVDVVDSYNPNLDQWTRLTPMSVPRSEAGCATLDGKIYVVEPSPDHRPTRLAEVQELSDQI
ncbi:hypothetical protein Bbelb_322050 [Branchiostoma belcheri]|nr:hypothetical protein Bbelb_322050 [Branchiostoma belcheri]